MSDLRWTEERAQAWWDEQRWFAGCNFSPSTAINQLEMWQAETFDPETLERELGFASELGLSVVRVYLHDLLWDAGPEAFCERIDRFLHMASAVDIQTMFVLFDDVWCPDSKLGVQPEPYPGRHNSGWVQGPGSRRCSPTKTTPPSGSAWSATRRGFSRPSATIPA